MAAIYFIGKYGGADVIGVVECDCDGQHIVEDVNRCAELLRDNPDKLFGDISEDLLIDIWRNEKLKKLRMSMLGGRENTHFVESVMC